MVALAGDQGANRPGRSPAWRLEFGSIRTIIYKLDSSCWDGAASVFLGGAAAEGVPGHESRSMFCPGQIGIESRKTCFGTKS